MSLATSVVTVGTCRGANLMYVDDACCSTDIETMDVYIDGAKVDTCVSLKPGLFPLTFL